MLYLNDVKKSYLEPNGNVLPVLDIPVFSVDACEQMVIVGRSGCGKSTLLHVIAGISRVNKGSVVVDGIDIAGLSESVRDRFRADTIGYVFQTFNLLPAFTALENVMMPLLIRNVSSEGARLEAEALLTDVGLCDRMTHLPSELSGGESQRVAFARALVTEPTVILADEPSGNLDATRSEALHDMMIALAADRGQTLVVVTHDSTLASRVDRVVRLQDGRLGPA